MCVERCVMTSITTDVSITNAESASWHDESKLMSDLAAVNKQISAYILRALDADAVRNEPTAPADEHALGERLARLGSALRARAIHRSTNVQSRTLGECSARDTVTRDHPRQMPTSSTDHSTAIYMP